MSVLTAANMADLIDLACKGYVQLVGTSASDMGIGESGASYGAYDSMADFATKLVTIANTDLLGDSLNACNQARDKMTATNVAKLCIGPAINAIEGHIRRRSNATIGKSIEAFMTYYNTAYATKWSCLAPSQWYDLYYAWRGVRPSVQNVYFEVLQGSTYANGLRKLVVSGATQTAGASVDSTKYCGGFPQIVVSGITGSGVVTVTGSQYNPATKTVTAGKTWTYTASADGTFALAPGTADADSLIVAVSNIAVAAGITAGTIYAEAARPSGRPLVG